MKYINRRVIGTYLLDQLTGNFLGFVVGMLASGLVSRFFETRSVRNLWGLASKKTVVDKDTFTTLEWVISLVIGFIVFEVVTKVIRERLSAGWPTYRTKVNRLTEAARGRFQTDAVSLQQLQEVPGKVMVKGVNAALKKIFP